MGMDGPRVPGVQHRRGGWEDGRRAGGRGRGRGGRHQPPPTMMEGSRDVNPGVAHHQSAHSQKQSAPRRFGSVEASSGQAGLKWYARGTETVMGGDDPRQGLTQAGATCVDDEEGQQMIYRFDAGEGAPAAPEAGAASPASPSEPRGVYFQDRRRQYAFACAGAGITLLAHLVRASRPMLDLNRQHAREEAERTGQPIEVLLAAGERLYSDKPNLKKVRGPSLSCASSLFFSLFERLTSPSFGGRSSRVAAPVAGARGPTQSTPTWVSKVSTSASSPYSVSRRRMRSLSVPQ